MLFLETSAKTRKCIQEVFDEVVQKVRTRARLDALCDCLTQGRLAVVLLRVRRADSREPDAAVERRACSQSQSCQRGGAGGGCGRWRLLWLKEPQYAPRFGREILSISAQRRT